MVRGCFEGGVGLGCLGVEGRGCGELHGSVMGT